MKPNDIFNICIQNLRRRKSRTFLTVLGVIIGCCSIVIMISIGIGMKESQEKMLSEMGDLNIITVSPAGRGKNHAKLNTATIEKIRKISNVTVVTPKLTAEEMTVKLYAGNNQRFVFDSVTLVGMKSDALESLGYDLKEGQFFKNVPYTILAGQNLAYSFADSKRPEGKNMIDLYSLGYFGFEEEDADGADSKLPEPYFNIMKTPLELELSAEDKKMTQKLTVMGRMKENNSKGYETSDGIVMRLEDLQKLKTEYQRLSGKKAETEQGYPSVLVKVDAIHNVAEVEGAIKSLGFMTSSMESIRKPMEKEAKQKQMMLGGLGAISLFVAALGITNTMIMSISERTKEIGIMKSIGCYVRDIRAIFLVEAGCIGFTGGVAGILLSVTVSGIMNILSAPAPPGSLKDVFLIWTTKGSRMSVIPLWLIGFALLFSVGIGIGSGYHPANKAVKISALEAIKQD